MYFSSNLVNVLDNMVMDSTNELISNFNIKLNLSDENILNIFLLISSIHSNENRNKIYYMCAQNAMLKELTFENKYVVYYVISQGFIHYIEFIKKDDYIEQYEMYNRMQNKVFI